MEMLVLNNIKKKGTRQKGQEVLISGNGNSQSCQTFL
jgi:hypothetical protein